MGSNITAPVLSCSADMNYKLRLGIILAAALLGGCATRVQVAPVNKTPTVAKGASALVTPLWWSEDSLDLKVVQQHRLGRLFRQAPEQALVALSDATSRSRQTEDIAALADLLFRYGQKLEPGEPQKSLGVYLAAAAIGYHHLVESRVHTRGGTERRAMAARG